MSQNRYPTEVIIKVIGKSPLMGAIMALNYEVNLNGICHGLAMMWVQAVLARKEDEFMQRYERLLRLSKTLNTSNLLEAVLQLKNFWESKSEDKKLEKEKLELTIDMIAFFDGILLYQRSPNFNFWERKITLLDPEPVAFHVHSIELEAQGGLKQFHSSIMFAENKDVLHEYMKALQKLLCLLQNISGTDIPVILQSDNHTIGLRFDMTQQKWLLIDIKQMPKVEVEVTGDIADEIRKALINKHACGFNIHFYTTGLHNDKLSSLLSDEVSITSIEEIQHFLTFPSINKDNINCKTNRDVTMLRIAMLNKAPKTLEIVKNIVTFKDDKNQLIADINVKDKAKLRTPLWSAVLYRQIEYIQLLLAREDLDVNEPNKENETPLHCAIKEKSSDIAMILLGREDIQISTRSNKDLTPLSYAIGFGLYDLTNHIISHQNFSISEEQQAGYTALHCAAEVEDTDIFLKLVKCGMDIHKETAEGDTAFELALDKENWEIAMHILMLTPSSDAKGKEYLNLLGDHRISHILDAFNKYIKKCINSEEVIQQANQKKTAFGQLYMDQQYKKLISTYQNDLFFFSVSDSAINTTVSKDPKRVVSRSSFEQIYKKNKPN